MSRKASASTAKDDFTAGERDPRAGSLRSLLAIKMGIVPGALRQAPSTLAAHYASQWAPVEELAHHLRRLPAGMLRFLASHPRGYLLVDSYTGYAPADADVQNKQRANVAHVAVADLSDARACLGVVGELLDHLLGCHGAQDGPWLSDGGGITSGWAEIGRQICQLYDLGYAVDEVARRSRRAYLARSIACFAIERKALNVADPPMERLLRHSLMNERFWERLSRPPAQNPLTRM